MDAGEHALSDSVEASAAARSAAREASWGVDGGGGGGEDVLGVDNGLASTWNLVAVEKRRKCRTLDCLGMPKGRRNEKRDVAMAIAQLSITAESSTAVN